LIRHAPSQPAAVFALAITMVQPAFLAPLVAPVGFPPLLPPRLLAATVAAIPLPVVTARAEKKQSPACLGAAKLLMENDP